MSKGVAVALLGPFCSLFLALCSLVPCLSPVSEIVSAAQNGDEEYALRLLSFETSCAAYVACDVTPHGEVQVTCEPFLTHVVNQRDEHGKPLLYYALLYNLPKLVKRLIECGADVNATVSINLQGDDLDNVAMVHCAALVRNDDLAVYLLSHGANTTVRASNGFNCHVFEIGRAHV